MVVYIAFNEYGTFSKGIFSLYQEDKLIKLMHGFFSFLEFVDWGEKELHLIIIESENQDNDNWNS